MELYIVGNMIIMMDYLIDIMMTDNVIIDGYIVMLMLAVYSILCLSRLVMFSGVLDCCMSWTCWFIMFYGVVWMIFLLFLVVYIFPGYGLAVSYDGNLFSLFLLCAKVWWPLSGLFIMVSLL